MDESYIHENYSSHQDSLYDPTDDEYIEPQKKFKGRRYCFVAAIINGTLDENEKPQILSNTIDIFEGGRTKDYHGMFDSTYMIG
ncbi:hypothetical protein A3Q56_08513 [Intoshia linei]|uniref:Uncharacterized protein n=1 Tax=Intoshia linei TaxID=1819745 RepID=A0A177APP1_9BILA|nr:hypothetical protein A3Q56_08513 [Intoshia linei]